MTRWKSFWLEFFWASLLLSAVFNFLFAVDYIFDGRLLLGILYMGISFNVLHLCLARSAHKHNRISH